MDKLDAWGGPSGVNVFAIIVFALLLVGVFVFVGWYFSADQRTKRKMRAIPVRAIGEVMEGEVARVVGKVRVDAPLIAPLSGRPCAYWRIVVEEKRRRGKHSYWQTLVDEEEGTDFLLLDDTGKAKVQVSYASAVLHGDAEGGSGFLNEPTPELDSFLSARGHSTQGWIFNKTIRFREGVAEPNELVAVVGMGKWERDPEEAAMAGEGYREAVMPKRLVLSAPSEGPLLLSDESDVTS
ncbi:MAG: hypothetical protein R3B82_09595 [Sandaracinaceae bacterium]